MAAAVADWDEVANVIVNNTMELGRYLVDGKLGMGNAFFVRIV